MARTVDQQAHARRREEILDAGQRLVMTKGYERMSIQDVLADLGISKGALYHYFASKQELLAGIVDRMADAIRDELARVAGEPGVRSTAKLAGLFEALAGWKVQHRDDLLTLLRVWYSDDNALLRQKVRFGITDRLAPIFQAVIEQGIDEGVFAPASPGELGRVLVSLLQDLNDRLAGLFFAYESGEPEETARAAVDDAVGVHSIALERILGLGEGSLRIVDPSLVHAWFGPTSTPKESS